VACEIAKILPLTAANVRLWKIDLLQGVQWIICDDEDNFVPSADKTRI